MTLEIHFITMKHLFFATLFACSAFLYGQSAPTSLGTWSKLDATIGIPKTNISVDSDLQLRLYNPFSNFQELVGRIGFTYHRYNNWSLTAGVARLQTGDFGSSYSDRSILENRIWQQFEYIRGKRKHETEQRSRLEQRWINNGSVQFSTRIRHRMLINFPLGRNTYRYRFGTRFFLTIYDELLISISKMTFDENRFYTGLGVNLGEHLIFRTGYLWQQRASASLSRIQFSVAVNTFRMKPPPKKIYRKPIIYFYPEDTTDVEVVLDYDGKLTHTYPKYNSGWKVKAYPDGTLIDDDGKEYYSLYWEGEPRTDLAIEDGFIIPGDQTIPFLEKTLAELGLNRKEANEFIIYWLPLMENNPFNFIHFSSDEYEKIAELKITPTPETFIRIMMVFKPLVESIDIKKQDITSLRKERKGFTVVEWGGQELQEFTP